MIWQYLLVISCSVVAGSPFLVAQCEQIRSVRDCTGKVCTGR